MTTIVIIELDGEEIFNFDVPHLSIRAGERLDIDVTNRHVDVWNVESESRSFEVQELSYRIRETYGRRDITHTSIQTIYVKEI
jgi:hypothetical protein